MSTNRDIACLVIDDEIIAQEIMVTHLSKIAQVKKINCCSSAIEGFNFLQENTVDLVFLDINMPEISGISFAKSINKNIKIIFTTAYRDYAVEGFELQAVDYLLKPISFERLYKAVNHYFENYNSIKKEKEADLEFNDFMFIRSERRMVKVNFNDIIYIESYGDYLKIHLKNNVLVTRETISTIEAKLAKNKFIRIHRSFIVSITRISSFTNEEICIHNKSLPISRSYKNEVLNLLEKYST